MKTTCQICAREIKANTGTIAHHGYQRPGNGWQTASCLGAKYLPYEQSRDRIPAVIESYKVQMYNQECLADTMLRQPEETITRIHLNRFSKESSTEDFTRPENFDPYVAVNKGALAFTYNSYENEFVKQYEMHRTYQKQIESEINFLQARFDNWVGEK